MPTYDFVCPSHHEFERFFRKISDAPMEMACPECGAIALRKVSGGAGLVFKGSGFYITDYGKDGKKPQGAPPKQDASGSTSGDGGTSGGGDSAKKTEKKEKKGDASGSKPSSSGSAGTE